MPGETWDYNSSMDMVLADLQIDGKPVKALMHAPKNGFFYVIDRAAGKLVSAEMIGKVNWATHVDLATGRPVEREGARYEDGEELIWPGPIGVHNWHAMSYNPNTGLVYIPVHELPGMFTDKGFEVATWQSPDFYMDTDVPRRGRGVRRLCAGSARLDDPAVRGSIRGRARRHAPARRHAAFHGSDGRGSQSPAALHQARSAGGGRALKARKLRSAA